MQWINGTEIDINGLSGEDICQKLAIEMYDFTREQRLECDEPLKNAMCIIDFDTEANMEGFATPYIGNFSADYYAQIVNAFRAVGDDNDADVIDEALQVDLQYTKLLDSAEDTDEADRLYEEFSDKIDELEQRLYLTTDFDMWSLLYRYLDEYLGGAK